MLKSALAIVLTIAAASQALAQSNASMPVGYDDPGPKPTEVLPPILADLRRTMKGPYSMRDFAICEPEVSKAFKYPGAGERWERAKWTVKFVLNAKNGFGGYAGLKYFMATFQEGRLENVSSPNLGALLNTKLVDSVAGCPRIADAELQRMLAS